MSLKEVIAELPRLTLEERQMLVRRLLELDEPSAADEELVEARLTEHHSDPNTSVSLAVSKDRLRSRSKS
jgi:hypothetical protein